jgi:hypothetical protein
MIPSVRPPSSVAMLRLLLTITVAWFCLSLLCGVLWVLLIELALRKRARHASSVIGASTQTLSEEKVEVLLTTPAAASDPIGMHADTSQLVRDRWRPR